MRWAGEFDFHRVASSIRSVESFETNKSGKIIINPTANDNCFIERGVGATLRRFQKIILGGMCNHFRHVKPCNIKTYKLPEITGKKNFYFLSEKSS
jgi:hypothetical protein